MATTAGLITVAEFRALQNPPGGYYELRNGELSFESYPPKLHQQIQMALAFALKNQIGMQGHVGVELGFRPTPEYNEWAADVALVPRQRWLATPPTDCLAGAPDLLAEVLSPSNTELAMNERAAVCLAAGCRQFWVIDPNPATVTVISLGRKNIIYGVGDQIDLAEFGGGEVSVAEIFVE
jgi:Uma2 family endonuclease